MMIIKRDSWHYKIANELTSHNVSDSLCLYFWQVIGACVILIFAGMATTFLGIVLLSPILMFLFDGLAAMGIGVCLILLPVLLTLLFKMGAEKSRDIGFVYVAVEWVKAKKKRVCPKLEFV